MLLDLSELLGCPIVLARGTFPYSQVAVPCLTDQGLQHAIETTLEMSASVQYQIEAFFVSLSRYISSEAEAQVYADMKKIIADMGLVYKAYIQTRELKGNPVHAITRELRERNLLVSELGSWRRASPLGYPAAARCRLGDDLAGAHLLPADPGDGADYLKWASSITLFFW